MVVCIDLNYCNITDSLETRNLSTVKTGMVGCIESSNCANKTSVFPCSLKMDNEEFYDEK